VIFGGLLVATGLSLFVVPAIYVLMKNLEAAWFPASQTVEPVGAAAAQQQPPPQP
jgi:HAE1 family hydrophobic/amphiphilic exporter-1